MTGNPRNLNTWEWKHKSQGSRTSLSAQQVQSQYPFPKGRDDSDSLRALRSALFLLSPRIWPVPCLFRDPEVRDAKALHQATALRVTAGGSKKMVAIASVPNPFCLILGVIF